VFRFTCHLLRVSLGRAEAAHPHPATLTAPPTHRAGTGPVAEAVATLGHALEHQVSLRLGQHTISNCGSKRSLVDFLHEDRQVGLGDPVIERNLSESFSSIELRFDLFESQAEIISQRLFDVFVYRTARVERGLVSLGCRDTAKQAKGQDGYYKNKNDLFHGFTPL
jgi:hypothetical protein